MSQLVEFPLTDGGTVLVQVSLTGGSPEIGEEPLTRGHLRERQEQLPTRAAETFDRAVRTVQPAAEALLLALTQISQPAEEVGIEFATALSAEAGALHRHTWGQRQLQGLAHLAAATRSGQKSNTGLVARP